MIVSVIGRRDAYQYQMLPTNVQKRKPHSNPQPGPSIKSDNTLQRDTSQDALISENLAASGLHISGIELTEPALPSV